MSLNLNPFDGTPVSFCQLTLSSYAGLGALFDALHGSDTDWLVDLDPRWRELILLVRTGEARPQAEAVLERLELSASWGPAGPCLVERPLGDGAARAVRSAKPGSTGGTRIEVRVTPGEAGSGVVIDGLDGPLAAVVEHGIVRALRHGPSQGHARPHRVRRTAARPCIPRGRRGFCGRLRPLPIARERLAHDPVIGAPAPARRFRCSHGDIVAVSLRESS